LKAMMTSVWSTIRRKNAQMKNLAVTIGKASSLDGRSA
jgi:hypothetical protein